VTLQLTARVNQTQEDREKHHGLYFCYWILLISSVMSYGNHAMVIYFLVHICYGSIFIQVFMMCVCVCELDFGCVCF